MSSATSNSTEPGASRSPEGPSRGAVAMVVVTLGLLGVLVWVVAPARRRFTPAPLEPLPAECRKVAREFVPSNITDLPGPLLAGLSPQQRNRALYRLNMEPCACGCGLSVAACCVRNPRCEISKKLAERIVAEVLAETPPHK